MEINKPTPACKEDKDYIKYIDDHRKNVFIAFNRFGQQICLCLSLIGIPYKQLRNLVAVHDISKYEPAEFSSYRQFFYPEQGQEKDDDIFKKAWRHHYQHNRHHWQYWIENGIPKPMDKLAVAEMVLDWIAMSIQNKTNPVNWYKQNKNQIQIDKQTRESVEKILDSLAATREYPFSIHRYRPGQRKKP